MEPRAEPVRRRPMSIKRVCKRTGGWLYLNTSLCRGPLRGAGVILMLHRVLNNDRAAELPHRNELCVGPEAFEHLLIWLQRYFECVPLMSRSEEHTSELQSLMRISYAVFCLKKKKKINNKK